MMKNISCLCAALLLAVSLTACGKQESFAEIPKIASEQTSAAEQKLSAKTGNSEPEGEDAPYCYNSTPMAEGPDCYYFRAGDLLFSIDKVTMEAVPLCQKADCLHHREQDSRKVPDCDAYFRADRFTADFLAFQDGFLYVIAKETPFSSDNVLFRLNSDGSGREIVCEVPPTAERFLIHRGWFYYTQRTLTENHQSLCGIYRRPLKGGREEVLFQSRKYHAAIQNLTAYEDHLYFTEIYEEDRTDAASLFSWDLNTGKLQFLPASPEKNDFEKPQFLDGRVYLNVRPERLSCNPDGSDSKPFSFRPRDYISGFFTDETSFWWYRPELGAGFPSRLQQMNADGTVLAEFPEGSITVRTCIIPGGKEHLFLLEREPKGDGEEDLVLYFAAKNPADGILKKEECLRLDMSAEVFRAISK